MAKTPEKRKTKEKTPLKKEKSLRKPKINRRKEWRFDLPLSAIVEGKLPKGKKFRETTTLENISSGGAYFCLDSGVVVGSKLNLVIEIPKKLTHGKKLKLFLGGITVRLEEANKKKKKQGVAVRFSKKFKVISEKDKNQ